MKIQEHVPSFTTGIPPKTSVFSNLKELLDIEWIKEYSKDDDFYRFSLLRRDSTGLNSFSNLMCEEKEGYKWWVIGIINGDISNLKELPEWKPKSSSLNKANELIDKYLKLEEEGCIIGTHAKQCAIICVEELIEEEGKYSACEYCSSINWLEVLQELKKM